MRLRINNNSFLLIISYQYLSRISSGFQSHNTEVPGQGILVGIRDELHVLVFILSTPHREMQWNLQSHDEYY